MVSVAPNPVVVQPKITGDAYPLQKGGLSGFDSISTSEQLRIVQRWQKLPCCAICCGPSKSCSCDCDRVLQTRFEVENSAGQVLYHLVVKQTDKCFSCFGGICCDKLLHMAITSADGKSLAEYEFPIRNPCSCGPVCCAQPPPTIVYSPPGTSIGEFSHRVPCCILCSGEKYLQLRDAQMADTIRLVAHSMTDHNMYCCQPCKCNCCDPNATVDVFGGRAEFMIVGGGPSDLGTTHSYSVFSRFLECCNSCTKPQQYSRKVVLTFPANLDTRCKVVLLGAVTYATYFDPFGSWFSTFNCDSTTQEPTVMEIADLFKTNVQVVSAPKNP